MTHTFICDFTVDFIRNSYHFLRIACIKRNGRQEALLHLDSISARKKMEKTANDPKASFEKESSKAPRKWSQASEYKLHNAIITLITFKIA